MNSKYKYSFSERLEMIANQSSHEDKIKTIHYLMDNNFLDIIDIFMNPTVEFLDKHENIEYLPCEEKDTDLSTRLDREARNLNIFTNKTKYPNMTREKRISLYKDILGSIHPKDAKLIDDMRKNKKLPYKLKPSLFIEAFPHKKEWVRG